MDGEQPKRIKRRATVAGCLTVLLGLLLALLLIFFSLPFVSLRGQLVSGRVHRSGGQLVGARIPHGVSPFMSQYQGRPSILWVLRIGDLYWGMHIPRRNNPFIPNVY